MTIFNIFKRCIRFPFMSVADHNHKNYKANKENKNVAQPFLLKNML